MKKSTVTKNDLTWPKMGKLPPKVKKILGERFGYLVVFGFAGIKGGNDRMYVECMCDCGKVGLYSVINLTSGNTNSCGCKMAQLLSKNRSRHGYAGTKKRHKIYITWRSIRTRCYNKNSQAYHRYGGRGIKVCNGWNSKDGFLSFANDMLPITNNSLDRINNDGHYSCGHCEECLKNGWPLNCRWADAKTQSSNTSRTKHILINGELVSLSECARRLGFSGSQTIIDRRNKGWSDEKIINTPSKRKGAINI